MKILTIIITIFTTPATATCITENHAEKLVKACSISKTNRGWDAFINIQECKTITDILNRCEKAIQDELTKEYQNRVEWEKDNARKAYQEWLHQQVRDYLIGK